MFTVQRKTVFYLTRGYFLELFSISLEGSSYRESTVLFFCANYCVIVTTNFSRCCGWLRSAAQPKLLFFTLSIQTFVLP